MTIVFRDRPLKPGEKQHHYCTECGQELHPDLAYRHKCKRKENDLFDILKW